MMFMFGQMENKEIKIEPIKAELRPLLSEFLMYEAYQAKFKEIAKAYGYKGDDIEKVRIALFTPDIDTNNICFVDLELYDMFTKFQIHKEIETNPNFILIHKVLPEKISFIETFMYDMLTGNEVDEGDLDSIYEELDAKLASMTIDEIRQILS